MFQKRCEVINDRTIHHYSRNDDVHKLPQEGEKKITSKKLLLATNPCTQNSAFDLYLFRQTTWKDKLSISIEKGWNF